MGIGGIVATFIVSTTILTQNTTPTSTAVTVKATSAWINVEEVFNTQWANLMGKLRHKQERGVIVTEYSRRY